VEEEDPAWLDRAQVERGQQVYLKYFWSFHTSLLSVLLHGFVSARFSKVLVLSGYAKSELATYRRFRDTSAAVYVWMTTSVLDPTAEGRRSITRVRVAHEWARRRSTKTFHEAADRDAVGEPLSQYDMALVLIAFAAVAVDSLDREFGIQLSDGDMEDLVATWRWIGYLLGIEDECNVASSVARCTQTRAEFYALVPHMYRDVHETSSILSVSLFEGLATYTFLPRSFFEALLWSVRRSWIDASWSKIENPAHTCPVACDALLTNFVTINRRPTSQRIANLLWRTYIHLCYYQSAALNVVEERVVAPTKWFVGDVGYRANLLLFEGIHRLFMHHPRQSELAQPTLS
jgi:hypothetical protein